MNGDLPAITRIRPGVPSFFSINQAYSHYFSAAAYCKKLTLRFSTGAHLQLPMFAYA
jgi:hypothetical protein